ncbi:ATPase [Halorubrum ezzemoulense]|uniref:ATPase n=1 Tax=Halorubrum ezzemoulense TaxID=337243 RepID=UPI00232FF668|nr:ATPase [Halorubrum ezzemoulense]MDB9278524.1 ATPase [Halorubrum ezzemoulense]MDB9282276.1 ATPase [Halorubrum ezzemoulense]
MTGDRSDPPTYLVAGGARVDAGKTTFSAGLVAHLADRAGDAVGVKPRAGNDLWFDHDDYLIATDAARLYGEDARTLAAANTRALAAADDGSPSPSAVTPESINPVHRLWRPTPGRTGMLGDAERTFLCDRVTTASGTRFVVNGAAEEAGLFPDALTDRLPLAEATRVRDVPAFNEVMAEAHLPAIERLADRVARTPVPVVVESYADVAGTLPRDGPVAPDAVAVVDPGRVRVYAGDRYAKARAVAAGSPREGTREEHVDAVTEMIEPLATVSLPALSGDVRGDPDRIAAAYEPAYATLTDSVEN